MQIYLVRHTTPQVEVGTCYGQTDLALAESFEQELEMVKSKLSHLQVARVYSSPLQRCAQLAQCFGNLGPIHYDPRMMELNFGDWEMKKWSDIPKGELDVWGEEHVMKAPPNGESFHNLSLRCIELITELRNQAHNESIVLFTHAGVIRSMLAHVMDLPLQNAFRLHVDYGSITQLDFSGVIPKVQSVNR